jgi:hypothetical protein
MRAFRLPCQQQVFFGVGWLLLLLSTLMTLSFLSRPKFERFFLDVVFPLVLSCALYL